jgi:hypothetical protein
VKILQTVAQKKSSKSKEVSEPNRDLLNFPGNYPRIYNYPRYRVNSVEDAKTRLRHL